MHRGADTKPEARDAAVRGVPEFDVANAARAPPLTDPGQVLRDADEISYLKLVNFPIYNIPYSPRLCVPHSYPLWCTSDTSLLSFLFVCPLNANVGLLRTLMLHVSRSCERCWSALRHTRKQSY